MVTLAITIYVKMSQIEKSNSSLNIPLLDEIQIGIRDQSMLPKIADFGSILFTK